MTPRFENHRQHINQLIQAALVAADPALATKRKLHKTTSTLQIGEFTYQLGDGRIFLLGIGKASEAMGLEAVNILGESVSAGILISKGDEERTKNDKTKRNLPSRIQIFEAGHPISDDRGVDATSKAISLIENCQPGDLVLCLISGGASALFTKPRIPLSDWQLLVTSLLGSGCTINELNSIRKQLDMVKGGGLALLAQPATCVSLILSDVVGNPLDVIGSGPTVLNPDDPATARQLLTRYNISARIHRVIWQRIEEQLLAIESLESPYFGNVHNFIIGDVRQAALAAAQAAEELGFESRLLTTNLEGEAREVGRVASALAKDAPPGSCLILGGETTVTLSGSGLGGRNQELALAAAMSLGGWHNLVVACFATDGDDGPTDAAGAVITGDTLPLARSLNIDPYMYLDQNDSYHFFEKVGGLLMTGQTGTNVNDLIFILKYKQ